MTALEMTPVGRVAVPAPAYQTAGAAGLDLHAAVEFAECIDPGARLLIPCGWAVAIPPGYEGQVRPRSGLALKHGITVLNAPGTIDADFRGELKVLLINHGAEPFMVRRGERVAQLVICPVAQATVVMVDALPSTERGEGGYGSTGVIAREALPTLDGA